jgi:hypothetical protein
MDFLTAFQHSAQWTGGWLIPAAAGLAISAAVVAIGWMIAEALRGSELRSWSRKELNEFVLSCAIVAVVSFSLWAFYGISLALTDGMDPFDVAKGFFSNCAKDNILCPNNEGLFHQTMRISQTLTGKTYVYELTGDIRFNFTALAKILLKGAAKIISIIPLPPAKAVSVAINLVIRFLPDIITRPFGSVDDISSGLDTYVSVSFFAALLSLAQLETLRFFQSAALQFLFPLGLVMRAFPVSRKIGSTLIALALVGAVAYPLSIIMSKSIYDKTAPIFGAPELAISTPKSIKVAVVDPEEGDQILLNDTIEWTVENGSSYRIWKSRADYKCSCPSSTCISSPDPPAYKNTLEWKSNATLFECLNFVKSGVANDTSVKVRAFDLVGTESDAIYSFVLDAYNGTTFLGFDEAKVIVGDPCRSSNWRWVRCMMGYKYVISEISAAKTGAATLGYMGAGILDAVFNDFLLGEIPKFLARQINSGGIPGIVGTGIFRMASTPVLAGQMLLGLSERLPAMMFPPMMVILSIVISAFVCLSSFRSVSELIGGETELPGLARVV